jgi:hypothetical protein
MASSPLFFIPVILIMIVPPIATAYAQQTAAPFSPSNDPATRQYGPPTTAAANVTTAINTTAAGGIQDMRQFMLSLASDIREHNLTGTYNEVVMAFAYIQGNLSELQEYTTNQTNASATRIAQLQNDLRIARSTLQATQEQLAAAVDAEEEETEEPEPTPTPPTSPTPEATATADIVEDSVESDTDDTEDSSSSSDSEGGDTESESESEETESEGTGGPRLDPEGDGGFPGDLDG